MDIQKIAIEKLLKAKNLDVDVEGFWVGRGVIYLNVEDDNADDFTLELAEFKLDHNDPNKVYKYKVLTDYSWAAALNKSADIALMKHDSAAIKKDKQIKEKLLALESRSLD
jgi:hypothetical protein